MKQILLCTLAAIIITACATHLTEGGSNVRLLDSAAEASNCKVIKTIYAKAAFGVTNATKHALNEAAAVGANSFYIISASPEGGNIHADVVGNALICPLNK